MPAEKRTKRTRKTAQQAPPVEEVKIPDVSEVLEEPEVITETDSSPVEEPNVVSPSPSSSRKGAANVEELELAFDRLVDRLSREIESKKEDKSKTMSLKTVRSITSDVKKLRKDSVRLARKGKRKATTRSNVESGFLKPVKVSKGMCKFAGWSPEDLHSRVDVTKFICNYVKEHDLQNPSDRRQIIPDKKLSKLLSYDAKIEDQPLTYFYLQKKIKDHFI